MISRHSGVFRTLAAMLLGCLPICSARAAPVQCADGRGVHRAISGPTHEIVPNGAEGTLVITKGRLRLSDPFAVTSSNGSARTSFEFAGKEAPSSVAMGIDPDVSPDRGEGSAPSLVTPDLPVSFYYWEPFRSRPDSLDLLPGDAWHLVRCSAGG